LLTKQAQISSFAQLGKNEVSVCGYLFTMSWGQNPLNDNNSPMSKTAYKSY